MLHVCIDVLGKALSSHLLIADECESNPCANNGTCINGMFGHACDCVPGYSGMDCDILVCPAGFTGPNCLDIDYCAEVTCQNDGSCFNDVDNFTCLCAGDYGGIFCEIGRIVYML